LQTTKNNAHQQQQNTHTPYHNQCEKSNSLEDVKSKDIKNVKKRLLQDLCDRKLCKDEDVDEYFDEIKQCMISKKVLMFVNDVDKTKNLGGLQLLFHKQVTNADCKSEVLVIFEIGKN
jgi:hypothetical protein